MAEVSVDYHELTAFMENFDKINVAELADRCNKELAARFLRKVILRTPVGQYPGKRVGGTLRRGWTTTPSGKYYSYVGTYVKTLSTEKVGEIFRLTVINSTEYASYVEYGHRKANRLGWVEGQFMATTSEKEIREIAPRVCNRMAEKYVKEKLG